MNKNRRILIAIVTIFSILILTSCGKVKKIKSDNDIDTERLEAMIGSFSEITHIFIFSRETCEYCIESIDSLNYVYDQLKNNNPTDKFIYFNSYDTDKNRNDENFDEILDGLEIKTVPALIIYDYEKNLTVKIDDLEIIKDKESLLTEITKVIK